MKPDITEPLTPDQIASVEMFDALPSRTTNWLQSTIQREGKLAPIALSAETEVASIPVTVATQPVRATPSWGTDAQKANVPHRHKKPGLLVTWKRKLSGKFRDLFS
jgi:hypothetical protein